MFEQLKKDSRPNEPSSGLNHHHGRTMPVAVLLIVVVLLSASSGIYAGASFFAQQAPGVTVTTTLYTTTTSWTTSTIWSTVTAVVQGVLTTVQYTTSTSTVTVTGFDAYTKLLLHMDGVDGSQTFIDSPLQTHGITARGNAQIDTAQSKFGGASGVFDGTGDYLSADDSADWYFGTGDFTIDFWVRFNALPSASGFAYLVDQSQDTNNRWSAFVYNSGGTYLLGLDVVSGGNLIIRTLQNSNPNLATATWYHIAYMRSGNGFYIFENGSQIGTTVTDTDSIPDFAGSLSIGSRGARSELLNGWLDELRVSKGVARWTSNFTPPTAPY